MAASRRRSRGSRARFARFCAVGASGLVVNTLVLAGLTARAHLFYLASALVATEIAIAWNFVLSEWWVFTKKLSPARGRFASFAILNNVAFALSGPLLWLLVAGAGLNYLVGNLFSIVALMLVRFIIADRLIWRTKRRPRSAAAPAMNRRQWVAVVAATLRAK